MKPVNRLLTFVMSFLMLASGAAGAADDASVYVIVKGDTLWGLSARFLNDPHYWPNLWSKNPQVTNPHFIYPGQTIRFKDGKMEIVEAAGGQKASASKAATVASAPAQQMVTAVEQDLVQEKTYKLKGNEGWLLESEQEAAGRVIAGQYGRVIMGEDDSVFTDIGTKNGGSDGNKYTILRKTGQLKHPVTNDKLGIKVMPIGSLQLTYATDTNSRAIINKSTKEIEPGDLLVPYKPANRRNIALKMVTAPLKGHIVESGSGYRTVAAGDLVYIDLGSAQGAEPGNLLYVTRKVKIEKMKVGSYVGQLPDEVLGALVILETSGKTSSALIFTSVDAIFVGDEIVSSAR